MGEEPTVEAAGGIVWRAVPAGVEVLVIHRPRYDDWSFPKGKLEDGESHDAAARREVEEETGLRCDLGAELGEVRYTDGRGRPKRVRYWAMTVTSGAFEPNREVDEVRWVSMDAARQLLTYSHDIRVLDGFASGAGSVASAGGSTSGDG